MSSFGQCAVSSWSTDLLPSDFDLVCLPAQEQAVCPRDPLGHDPENRLVDVRDHPTAVGESAATVLLRTAGGLHHPIDGHKGSDNELHDSSSINLFIRPSSTDV